MDAAQHPDIVSLYTSISTNPQYLEVHNEMPFAQTPLHKAAGEGRADLALEILRLNPSLGKKLNLDGLSPLDLALHNEHASTVERIVNHDPNLIRVPGRGGITPLHYVVETEKLNLLIKFLLECPSSIKDFTIRDETAVHIAVRKGKFRAFKVLLGWIVRTGNTEVLRCRDKEGNAVLQLAALANQHQVMELLIGKVNVNDKNLEGKTALDILEPGNENARQILMRAGAKHGTSLVKDTTCEDYLSSRMSFYETLIRLGAYLQLGLSGSMRNAILVVAALIATSTYQAALTPPADENILAYTILNTVVFDMAFGTCAVLILVLASFPLYSFLFVPLCAFFGSYVALAYYRISNGIVSMLISIVISIILPVVITLPWSFLLDGTLPKRRSSVYSRDEVKYIVFTAKYDSKNLK